MAEESNVPTRVRLVGLCASIIGVVAPRVNSDSHDTYFGRLVTLNDQVVLLFIVAFLFAPQAIAYIIHRRRTFNNAIGPSLFAAAIARSQPPRDL